MRRGNGKNEISSSSIEKEIFLFPLNSPKRSRMYLIYFKGGNVNEAQFRRKITRWNGYCWRRVFIRIGASRLFTGRFVCSGNCFGQSAGTQASIPRLYECRI